MVNLVEARRAVRALVRDDGEALMKEARRRTRQRRLLTSGAVILLAGLSGGSYAILSHSPSFPTGGSVTTHAGAGAASDGKVTPDQPIALAVSRGGNLYIADRGRNEVLDWSRSREFGIVAGSGVAGLTGDGEPANRAEVDNLDDLVLASNGTLYFTQAGHYSARVSSSGGMPNTVIREVTPAGTIRTVAGLDPSCPAGPVRSVSAESGLFYGAGLSLSRNAQLAVDADLCVSHRQGFGPNLLLSTSSNRFTKDTLNRAPAATSIDCGSGVAGPGFDAFGCTSGGGDGPEGHGNQLLVVTGNGSSVAYPEFRAGDFAASNSEVVATYDGSLVRVTDRRLIPLLTNAELLTDLRLHARATADIGGLTVGTDGDIYFIASILGAGTGCQNRILERTNAGTLQQLWSSSASRNNTCF
jgi:hypothetical protein